MLLQAKGHQDGHQSPETSDSGSRPSPGAFGGTHPAAILAGSAGLRKGGRAHALLSL